MQKKCKIHQRQETRWNRSKGRDKWVDLLRLEHTVELVELCMVANELLT